MWEQQRKIRKWAAYHDVWYIQLDIEIPEECGVEAQKLYDLDYYVTHRDAPDWGSTPLWGWYDDEHPNALKNTNAPVNANKVTWGWTEAEEHAPVTKSWMEDQKWLKFCHRARFMLLKPKGVIPLHQDGHPYARKDVFSAMNFAFTQPEDCILYRHDTGDHIPFEVGTGFWFDNSVEHTVKNHSQIPRFHFIMHPYNINSKEYLDLMERSMKKQFGNDILKEVYNDNIKDEDIEWKRDVFLG
jgi:hypothetical protein